MATVEGLLTELATAGWVVRVWVAAAGEQVRWYAELCDVNGWSKTFDATTLAGALAKAHGG